MGVCYASSHLCYGFYSFMQLMQTVCELAIFSVCLPQQLMVYVDGRLLNDLVLWEPMAPKPIDTQETNSFMPGSAWSPHLVAQLMHQGPVSESFSACKSGVQYGM